MKVVDMAPDAHMSHILIDSHFLLHIISQKLGCAWQSLRSGGLLGIVYLVNIVSHVLWDKVSTYSNITRILWVK